VAAVIAELENEMSEAAEKLEFERAAVLRDQVEALRSGDFRKIAKIAKPGGKRAVRYGSNIGKTAKRQRR
jgi:excinuclease ABC subunit B